MFDASEAHLTPMSGHCDMLILGHHVNCTLICFFRFPNWPYIESLYWRVCVCVDKTLSLFQPLQKTLFVMFCRVCTEGPGGDGGGRPAVAVGGELPEGAAASDDEPAPRDDPHRALDLDLDMSVPFGPNTYLLY